MKLKLGIIFFLILINVAANAQNGKAKTREGIQQKGEFRVKLIYPFAQTFGKNRDFNLNKVDKSHFKNSFENYYNLGTHSTSDHDTNFHLHYKDELVQRGGISLEYNIHKRLSVEGGIKIWKFNRNWDSNYVKQVGTFRHIGFPLLVRYEFYRRKFFSAKIGTGYEFILERYKNFPEIEAHCTKWDFIFCVEKDFKFKTESYTLNRFRFLDCGSIELTFGFRLSKKFSVDYYTRFSAYSNIHQLGLSYLLGGKG